MKKLAVYCIGIKAIMAVAMTRQEYNDYRGWQLPADEDGTDEGYLVEYVDGASLIILVILAISVGVLKKYLITPIKLQVA